MTVEGDYLGMRLCIDALDRENLAYFRHCAAHDFRLQRCAACGLLRYPPTTGCPWCAHPEAVWAAVDGRGAVYTYAEVHHAIQPAFQDRLPYLILIVELYTQLAARAPSPVVELNRAVAVAMASGPRAGLDLVDRLQSEPALGGYHLLPSVRGDLLKKLGRIDEARGEFERAASLTRNVRERDLLLARARECV